MKHDHTPKDLEYTPKKLGSRRTLGCAIETMHGLALSSLSTLNVSAIVFPSVDGLEEATTRPVTSFPLRQTPIPAASMECMLGQACLIPLPLLSTPFPLGNGCVESGLTAKRRRRRHLPPSPTFALAPRLSRPQPAYHTRQQTGKMGKDVRVTYKRRHAYATRSNRRQILRTPGTCWCCCQRCWCCV